MKILIKKAVQGLLKRLNLWVIRYDTLQKLEEAYYQFSKVKKFTSSALSDSEHEAELFQCVLKSKSQILQDIFVLKELNCKKGGYFVEFGVCDGVKFSNTHLLEKEYGWKGIIAEPARCWHKDLHKNRNCHIETQAVWKKSGQKLVFNQTIDPEISTINMFSSEGLPEHTQIRKHKNLYELESISLMGLLEKHNAPEIIDYISIDTEGSEWEILNAFNFEKYEFRTITVEHNDAPFREKIYNLLSKHGYTQKYANVSEFDDWYVKESLL